MQVDAGVEDREAAVDEVSPAVPVARWIMAAALISLNFLDVVTTKLILRAGGSEANPLMRRVIQDPFAAFGVKLTMALAVGMLLLRAPAHSKLADRAVLLAIGCYTLVIGWNTGLLVAAVRAGRLS